MPVRRPLTYVSEFSSIVIFLIALARPIVRQVAMLSHVNGEVNAEGAEEIGIEVSESLGDLRVNIKNIDVLDKEAQELLARGVARLTFRVIQAVRYGR
tara:strand:- start:115 stop:408 length:294 start_codon:yes stop_codon:yes gene_type:complete